MNYYHIYYNYSGLIAIKLLLNCSQGSYFVLILQSVDSGNVQDSLSREEVWGCVGGRALIWRKLLIIQLSTLFPLVHRNWINCQKAAKSEKVKGLLCTLQLLQWTKPNKALEKEPLDLGKHNGASHVSLCNCPAWLAIAPSLWTSLLQKTLDREPSCVSQCDSVSVCICMLEYAWEEMGLLHC